MRRSLCVIATLLLVIACAMGIHAQAPTKAPATESSPKSTKPVDAPPASDRQKPVVDIDPFSTSTSLEQLVKALESAGVTNNEKATVAAADSITIYLQVRAAEPFEKVKQLIEGLRDLGVTKLILGAASERSQQGSASVMVDANTPQDLVKRITDYLTQQNEFKFTLRVKARPESALLLVKSDWSQVPAAKEIEAELRQVLKDITIPQAQLDKLPASAVDVLFAPEIAAIYSSEHYGQLLAWLTKHGLVVQTVAPTDASAIVDPESWVQLNDRCEFLRLPPIPQAIVEPFVTRWAEFAWYAQHETKGNTIRVSRMIWIMEQGRGQAKAKQIQNISNAHCQFTCETGKVAILNAFPNRRDETTLRQSSREQGFELLLVLNMGRKTEGQQSINPQLRLPDQVDVLRENHNGLLWPTTSQDSTASTPTNEASPTTSDVQIINLSLKNSNAGAVAELVKQLFRSQSFSVGVDDRTNSILIRGPHDVLAQIELIVKTLDQPSKASPDESGTDSGLPNSEGIQRNSRGGGQRFSAVRSPGKSAELKKGYEAEEQKAALKAQELRELLAKGSAKETRIVQLRTELRAAVAAAFSARQQLHLTELAEFQNRARQIQQTIALRNDIQDQIIDRRVEDLLNPDVRWDSDKTGGPSASLPSSDSPRSGSRAARLPGASGLPGLPGSSEDGGNLPRDPTTVPPNSNRSSTPLSDAVRAFNAKYAEHPIGKDQPPLTDDEIVATIRWSVSTRESRTLSAADSSDLNTIAESRMMPDNGLLTLLTEFKQPDGSKLTKWTILLTLTRSDGSARQHVLREQFVRWYPRADAAKDQSAVDPNAANLKGTPLAAAIHGFNLEHQSARIGKDQPPLTEEEVIAAIRWWKTKRNEADLMNEEFQAFQAIADTRMLPEKVKFEVLTGFQPNQEFVFNAWSVRIVMPRLSKAGWTYAFSIRDRWINSRRLDDRQISWGPAAPNGIQAGVMFDPRNEQYATGQQILPRFFYRNVGSQELTVAFPRLMTHSYYEALHAVDNAGRDIAIDQDPGPVGPVGWIEMPLDPKSQHEISGLPIVLGDVPRAAGVETVIRAQPGQSCRVRFTVPNYGEPKSEPLQTGEIQFTLANRAELAPKDSKSQ